MHGLSPRLYHFFSVGTLIIHDSSINCNVLVCSTLATATVWYLELAYCRKERTLISHLYFLFNAKRLLRALPVSNDCLLGGVALDIACLLRIVSWGFEMSPYNTNEVSHNENRARVKSKEAVAVGSRDCTMRPVYIQCVFVRPVRSEP